MALEVTGAEWEALPEPIEGLDWMVKVVLTGSGLINRAMPLVASVGEVRVEALTGSPLGDSAQGFLSALPAVGARLVIGYPDTGAIETEVEFQGLP